MHSIKLRSHVGSDGVLHLQVPVGVQNSDIEVMIIVQPIEPEKATTPQDQGWPPGFFEQTFGSIPDLERPPQGAPQIREPVE